VRFACARARRKPDADDRAHDDQRRPVVGRLEHLYRIGERCDVLGIADGRGLPAIGCEALGDILVEGQVGAALNRDAVAVVDPAQVR
jgi:hypothetical protein